MQLQKTDFGNSMYTSKHWLDLYTIFEFFLTLENTTSSRFLDVYHIRSNFSHSSIHLKTLFVFRKAVLKNFTYTQNYHNKQNVPLRSNKTEKEKKNKTKSN